ncbi:MAG: hypothetical protein OCD02_24065 [Spirochaetaceae bacterium]
MKQYPSILLFIIFQINIIYSNPISTDIGAYSISPISFSKSGVYLNDEIIEVNVNKEISNVKATYTFRNTHLNSTRIQIVLPFCIQPFNIKILNKSNNSEIEYSAYELNKDFKVYSKKFDEMYLGYFRINKSEQYPAISFYIDINAQDITTIEVTYKRPYEIYDYKYNDEIYYSFNYIAATGRYWQHPIEKAEFIIKIPKELIDFDKYSKLDKFYADNDHIIYKKTKLNWSPKGISNEDDFFVLWTNPKPNKEHNRELDLILD